MSFFLPPPSRRAGQARAPLAALAAIGAAAAIDGIVVEPGLVVASHHTFALCGLPPALEGLTIAHLSDLHVGAPYWRPDLLARAVKLANQLRPDLIVITGDFADSNTAPVLC